MKSKTSGESRRGILAWCLIALLFLAPVGGLAAGAAVLASDRERGSQGDDPIFTKVERSDFFDEQAVKVTLDWADGVALKAPAWAGLVTDIGVASGDTVRAGTRIVRVDGIWRVAAPTPVPLHEAVHGASPREETAALNSLLRAMGYDAPGESWSWTTLVAVRNLAVDIGVPGGGYVDFLDPAWLVWSPRPEITATTVSLTAGAAAPALGEDVVVGPPRLTRVSVAPQEGGALPSVEGAEEWVLRVGKASVAYGAAEMADGIEGSSLAESLAASEPAEVEGVLERVAPVTGWQVPIGAVHTDAAGNQCVFREVQGDTAVRAVPVRAQRGAIGTARVHGALGPRARVLINPADVVGDRSCG